MTENRIYTPYQYPHIYLHYTCLYYTRDGRAYIYDFENELYNQFREDRENLLFRGMLERKWAATWIEG